MADGQARFGRALLPIRQAWNTNRFIAPEIILYWHSRTTQLPAVSIAFGIGGCWHSQDNPVARQILSGKTARFITQALPWVAGLPIIANRHAAMPINVSRLPLCGAVQTAPLWLYAAARGTAMRIRAEACFGIWWSEPDSGLVEGRTGLRWIFWLQVVALSSLWRGIQPDLCFRRALLNRSNKIGATLGRRQGLMRSTPEQLLFAIGRGFVVWGDKRMLNAQSPSGENTAGA